MAVQGPGLQPGGIIYGLRLRIAVDPGAAYQQRPNLHALPHAQSAGALGAQQALVAGEAHHIDLLALHVNGKRSRRLGRVQHKKQPMGAAERPYPLHIQHIAGEIRAVGTDHYLGIGPQQTFKRIIVQPALPVRRDKVHLRPRRPQAVQRPEHRVVVPVGGDHMIPRPQKAVKRRIEGLGGIDGKAYPLRCGSTQKRRHLSPHPINGPGR